MAAAALLVSGCASAFGGYDLAPNGLPEEDASLRRGLAEQPSSTHEAVVEGEHSLPDDDLLRLLFAGTTGRYAGEHVQSGQLLDVAGYLADDRVTESISRQALSFITNDRALPYTPSPTERLMIPYVAAVNFLEAGDVGAAVVEARRIEALLDFDDGERSDDQASMRRFLHAFAGTVFDAASETNAADVAYRRAGLSGPPRAAAVDTAGVPQDSLGEVVVLVERGFVPHRVEQSVVIVLPPVQVKALTQGDAGEKALAATEAAARALITAAYIYGDQGPYYTDRSYRRSVHLSPWRDECGDDGLRPSCAAKDFTPYLLRISWPVLRHEPVSPKPPVLRVAGAEIEPVDRFDVSSGIRRDFEAERGTLVARTIFRAATKMALSAGAEEAVSRSDETAGRIVGFLVNLGTLLTERADTRSWHLLPGRVELIRVRLPAGEHDLRLEGDGWLGRGADLGTVTVRPGRTSFVAHRIWQ